MKQKEYAEKKYLDSLFKRYQDGVLDKPGINLLKAKGYITERGVKYVKEGVKPELSRAKVVSTQEWLKMMDPFSRKKNYSVMRPVLREAWEPDSRIEHTKEFVHWIDSMLYGAFSNKAFYKKFDLYKAQAWQWLQDTDTYMSYNTTDERKWYAQQEYNRCEQNTLYFANKYGQLKEGDAEHGFLDYKAREHHAVIFYLCDCGYNFIGGKGRQIGFTSAMGLFATKKLVFSFNYFMKFISEDEDTSEEIFVDKIKYPFTALPSWMKPQVKSDRGTKLELSDKKKKGEQGYPNSRIMVQPPRKTGINGGSPQLVLMDEIGNIGILTAMLNEGRPTMFWNNPKTGEFEMKRQIIGWSTGGSMDKSKGAYEREWGRITSLWEQHRFRQSGFIPLFFSWHARFSKDEYNREKEWYYGARAADEDMDLEESKTQFHQHYPSSAADMFVKTANTLVNRDITYGGLDRCKNLDVNVSPVYGFFEPVYDFSDPMPPESDIPYRIIDATFVPLNDGDDPKLATTIMFQKPQKGWKNRYWQGTDPIAAETGHSKMSSSMWDDYYKTISCLVNYRKQHDHRRSFLQVLLMGLYYDTRVIKQGVKELVEANIGTNYIDYKRDKGFFDTLVFNSELPAKVLGGAREIGIDNKGTRAFAIIDFMTELFNAFHSRFYIKVIFDQLSTFVLKMSASGKETWEAQNKLLHYDDVLFAITFSYICKLSFPNRQPVKEVAEHTRTRVRYKLMRNTQGELIRQPVKETVNETRLVGDIPDNIF